MGKVLIRTERAPDPSAKPGTGGALSPCRAFYISNFGTDRPLGSDSQTKALQKQNLIDYFIFSQTRLVVLIRPFLGLGPGLVVRMTLSPSKRTSRI